MKNLYFTDMLKKNIDMENVEIINNNIERITFDHDDIIEDIGDTERIDLGPIEQAKFAYKKYNKPKKKKIKNKMAKVSRKINRKK